MKRKRSKHTFIYEPVTAIGSPGDRGNYGVRTLDDKPAPGLEPRTVDRCICTRCGTSVWTNQPTQARAVANVMGIDCDTVLVEAVHSL